MIDREKLMTALTQCAELMCIKSDELCVYYKECDWEGGQHSMACENAIAALREDADEIDDLRNQVYNLSIYLEEIFELMPGSKSAMEIRHPGLPGYVEVGLG